MLPHAVPHVQVVCAVLTQVRDSPLYVWPPSGSAGFQVLSKEKMSLVTFWTGTGTAITAVVRTQATADTLGDPMMMTMIIEITLPCLFVSWCSEWLAKYEASYFVSVGGASCWADSAEVIAWAVVLAMWWKY